MKLVLVLHNIRSCYNVGAILRTAEGFGVKEVVLSGYTPRVHDPSLLPHLREKLDKEIHKTALGAEDMVRIKSATQFSGMEPVSGVRGAKLTEVAEDLPALLSAYREQGFKIVGLENHVNLGTCLINDPCLKEKIGEKVVLVLGEEVKGIPVELYDLIDMFVEIPMRGKKESFNVSVAAGIAMYAIMNI